MVQEILTDLGLNNNKYYYNKYKLFDKYKLSGSFFYIIDIICFYIILSIKLNKI